MMFDCPTVEDVMSLVSSSVAESTATGGNRVATYSASMNIRAMPMNAGAALTLTREQYLFWSHSLMFPSSCAYNMGFVLQFDEAEVDERDLHPAVTRVVVGPADIARHVTRHNSNPLLMS
jgi:hypothetical protein